MEHHCHLSLLSASPLSPLPPLSPWLCATLSSLCLRALSALPLRCALVVIANDGLVEVLLGHMALYSRDSNGSLRRGAEGKGLRVKA